MALSIKTWCDKRRQEIKFWRMHTLIKKYVPRSSSKSHVLSPGFTVMKNVLKAAPAFSPLATSWKEAENSNIISEVHRT